MPDEPALEQPRSLLAPYSQKLFVAHRGWIGLSQILETRGAGSYGLSGPRGAGKTWVMERALEVTGENGGLGVLFPSPSEYEPLAFLSSLSDNVAAAFEELHDEVTERPTRVARARFYLWAWAGIVLTYLSAAVFFLANFASPQNFNGILSFGNAVLLLLFVVGLYAVFIAMRRRQLDREGLGLVRAKAEELRSQVRYTVTSVDTEEMGLEGKYGPLNGLLKRARERQLVERPATLSSLIHSFRGFVRLVAAELDKPVVIAIDELDKMSDVERVAQLLRDIKGIFEIPGACFLVSLSDEAAQALELGALRAKNEFNSSFYTVISMPPLSPAASLDLLRMRDVSFDSLSGRALGVLTGGVSRELVRVAEMARTACSGALTVEETVVATIGEELNAFGSMVLQTAGSPEGHSALGDEARIELFDAVDRGTRSLENGGEGLPALLEAKWDLNSGNAFWQENFAEEWRRLLVRLGVAAQLLRNPQSLADEAESERLQRIVQITAASAAVGRRYLARDSEAAAV